MATDITPCTEQVHINGEPLDIRLSLGARERIREALGLDSLESMSETFQSLDGVVLSKVVAAMLVDQNRYSAEDILEADMPLVPTQRAVLDALSKATFGIPLERVESEEDDPPRDGVGRDG